MRPTTRIYVVWTTSRNPIRGIRQRTANTTRSGLVSVARVSLAGRLWLGVSSRRWRLQCYGQSSIGKLYKRHDDRGNCIIPGGCTFDVCAKRLKALRRTTIQSLVGDWQADRLASCHIECTPSEHWILMCGWECMCGGVSITPYCFCTFNQFAQTPQITLIRSVV